MKARGRVLLVLVAALSLLAAACGSDDEPGAPGTTTTVVTRTLVLRDDGLDAVAFGDRIDDALPILVGLLGEATADTAVTADMPDGLGGPQTTLRTLRWGALSVSFLDWSGSPFRADRSLHMARWIMAARTDGNPELATPEQVRLGSTVADVRRAYGANLPIEFVDYSGAWEFLPDPADPYGLVGRLDRAPTDPAAQVVYLAAGLRSSP